MRHDQPRLLELAVKTIVVHTVTYFAIGGLAFYLLDYAAVLSRPDMASWMRQPTDPILIAGPLFQPIRGVVFALAIYPVQGMFWGRQHGWLLLWWMLLALGIISTFGPAPGSLEGLVYTRIPILNQLLDLREVVVQSLLLASGLAYWVNHPQSRWLTWVMAVAFVVVLLMPIAGLLVGSRGA